jgi:hypothetical protein
LFSGVFVGSGFAAVYLIVAFVLELFLAILSVLAKSSADQGPA